MTIANRLMGSGVAALAAQETVGSVTSSATATGTTQTDALTFDTAAIYVTTTPSGSGVRLFGNAIRHSSTGDEQTVHNYGANALNVYPPVGDTIQGFSANAPLSVSTSSTCTFKKVDPTTWICKETYTASGTGALTTDLQTRGRKFALTSDYSSTANFNTAVAALTETLGVSSLQVKAGGLLGIGATAPGADIEMSKVGAWPVIRYRKSGTGFWDLGPLHGNFFGLAVNGGTDIVTVDNTGLVGINQQAPLAQLHVGTRTAVPITTLILASNEFANTTSRHGFGDFCSFDGQAATGYASFDSYAQIEGTNNIDHWVGFQCRLEYDNSGTMNNGYGFYSGLHVNAGTVTDLTAGLHVLNPTSTSGGAVTNLYGIRIEALSRGATLNYAIMTEGTTPSSFGGAAAGGALLRSSCADGVYSFGASGTTKGIRFEHTSALSKITGCDNTLNSSLQPLNFNGSRIKTEVAGTVIWDVHSGGGILTGTARISGAVGLGGVNESGTVALNLPASTTGIASLRIAHGAAPTAPVNGDMWTTTAGLFVQINGVTKTVAFV